MFKQSVRISLFYFLKCFCSLLKFMIYTLVFLCKCSHHYAFSGIIRPLHHSGVLIFRWERQVCPGQSGAEAQRLELCAAGLSDLRLRLSSMHLRPEGENFDYTLWTVDKPSDSWLIASVDVRNTSGAYQVSAWRGTVTPVFKWKVGKQGGCVCD